MLSRYRIPKTLQWVVSLFLIFLLIFTIFRFATYLAFVPAGLRLGDLLQSFGLGIRYDVRWIAIVLLPITFLGISPRLSPFYSERNKKWWTWYLAAVTFIVFFFFAADFGCFAYNKTRLDAGALNFAEDARISMAMLWQTYPMFWLVLGLIVAVLFFRAMYHKNHWNVISKTDGLGIPHRRIWFIVATVLLSVMVYGTLGTSSLKWSRAFILQDNFKSYLALNPLQNFFTTLKFRKPQFNEHKAREAFPLMAEWMPLSDNYGFTYRREIAPRSQALESRPNVVLVLCESFSMYKSSMSGNPLGTTPFFNEMTRDGVFFDRCFSPHFSTARGLFATLTGIPDVQAFKFSTRNPEAVQQHTIINSFEDYRKFYFLGGSPEFNNFKGILHNIDGLQMFTEGRFSAPRINVWGISDKDLFLEANKVFRQQEAPFFAIIQTADNHRPFMIPKEDVDFEKKQVPDDTLSKYGFESIQEFNSFRYTDYCFRKFIQAAEQEDYFHNTLFVFVGDHGVSGNATALYPEAWTAQRLTDEHVPLLFYAPYLLQPAQHHEVVSQIDVLPTIAGLISESYVNTTLGRDLLDPSKKNDFAFIVNGQGKIGLLTNEHYFLKNIDFTQGSGTYFPDEEIYSLKPGASSTANVPDSVRQKYSSFTSAFYETAKWMLVNNKNH